MTPLAVIIPFYNGDEFIRACLESIYARPIDSWPTYIVNNSNRKTAVRDIAKDFPLVSVIDTKPRIGFGKACNLGATFAIENGAEMLIIVNQDTIIAADAIHQMVAVLSANKGVALAAPVQFTYDFGRIEEFFIKYYITQCPDLFRDALDYRVKDYYAMERVSGACIAIKSSIVKTFGLFDPLYRMYYEDEGLCRRLINLGLGVALVPRAAVAHAHSHTSSDREIQGIIARSKRVSYGIYRLTDIHESYPILLAKLLVDNFCDLVFDIVHGRFSRAFVNIVMDITILTKLWAISHSRYFERSLISEHARSSRSRGYVE